MSWEVLAPLSPPQSEAKLHVLSKHLKSQISFTQLSLSPAQAAVGS
jgi:hypothetical protein